jgi:GST-like protein
MDPKIKLYTAMAPNGRKVSIALEELALPYEVIRLDLAAGDQMEEDFLALNPNHKIPVLDDDGQIIWESGAILLHLAEKYGGLLPKEPRARMEAIQYAFFQTGGIGPNLGRLGGELRKPEEERNQAMMEIFSAEVDRLFGVLDRILADDRPFLAGEYSIGDIMHYGWLGMALDLKLPLLMKHERVVAWLERIASRPAVQRGMQVP